MGVNFSGYGSPTLQIPQIVTFFALRNTLSMSIELSLNLPLSVAPLEVLYIMTGSVSPNIQNQVLSADIYDDLSGLREMAVRLQDPDGWHGIRQPKQ